MSASREGTSWRRIALMLERNDLFPLLQLRAQTLGLCLLTIGNVDESKMDHRRRAFRPKRLPYHRWWKGEEGVGERILAACFLAVWADLNEPIFRSSRRTKNRLVNARDMHGRSGGPR